MFLNHNSYSEGEVLLFRTKKYRHRAIPVMSVASYSSKFSDSLTFKEWLQRAYGQPKALKVSVRTTEVVRPVLQHLYASKHRFVAPIIIHANTFDSGRDSREKAVDPIVFIRSVEELVPEAVISLGWTPSADYAAKNPLDWAHAFRLLSYIYELEQPIILNMKLNDAVHSIEQLEWLLGTDQPSIYLILKGELIDYVDSDLPLKRLASLSFIPSRARKILFDVDESWRQRLDQLLPVTSFVSKKEKRSVSKKEWQNVVLASPHSMLSTSIVSTSGIAFLGWPNSLIISTKEPITYPSRQRISGRLRFFAKPQNREIWTEKKSGMVIQLFEGDLETELLESPLIEKSILIYIGYDGRMSIENNEWVIGQEDYYKSTSAQLPKWPCYGFDILDRGWRIEMDIWSEKCPSEDTNQSFHEQIIGSKLAEQKEDSSMANYRAFLQLDIPITRSHKSRRVAVSKIGDGTIDFLFGELSHSAARNLIKKFTTTQQLLSLFSLIFSKIYLRIL